MQKYNAVPIVDLDTVTPVRTWRATINGAPYIEDGIYYRDLLLTIHYTAYGATSLVLPEFLRTQSISSIEVNGDHQRLPLEWAPWKSEDGPIPLVYETRFTKLNACVRFVVPVSNTLLFSGLGLPDEFDSVMKLFE